MLKTSIICTVLELCVNQVFHHVSDEIESPFCLRVGQVIPKLRICRTVGSNSCSEWLYLDNTITYIHTHDQLIYFDTKMSIMSTTYYNDNGNGRRVGSTEVMNRDIRDTIWEMDQFMASIV